MWCIAFPTENDCKINIVSVSAFEKRASSKDFMEITQDEFMSVSELIRGRSKIDDINKVCLDITV